MNNYCPFFRYITGHSLMHLMNSKMKIIWFLMLSLTILLIKDYLSFIIVLFVLLIIIFTTKISIYTYLKNVLSLWFIYAFIFALIIILSSSFSFSVFMLLKLILLILLFSILTFTTSLSEIAWGFNRNFDFLNNLKIPVSKISLKIAMNIKFISTISDEYRIVKKSMAYRGIKYKRNSIKSFFKTIIIAAKISYRQSRKMIKAMRLRFYGNSKRTNYHENKVTIYDKILIASSVILLYVVVLLGWIQ